MDCGFSLHFSGAIAALFSNHQFPASFRFCQNACHAAFTGQSLCPQSAVINDLLRCTPAFQHNKVLPDRYR